MALDLHSILTSAATIDELLGLSYQSQVGQKESTDRAALRLASLTIQAGAHRMPFPLAMVRSTSRENAVGQGTLALAGYPL